MVSVTLQAGHTCILRTSGLRVQRSWGEGPFGAKAFLMMLIWLYAFLSLSLSFFLTALLIKGNNLSGSW